MAIRTAASKIRLSMVNAVHDLAVLMARDEGLFQNVGLDVEVVTIPGTAWANPVGQTLHNRVFDRNLETLYDSGGWTNTACASGV